MREGGGGVKRGGEMKMKYQGENKDLIIKST